MQLPSAQDQSKFGYQDSQVPALRRALDIYLRGLPLQYQFLQSHPQLGPDFEERLLILQSYE